MDNYKLFLTDTGNPRHSEMLTNAQMLLTAFVLDLQPLEKGASNQRCLAEGWPQSGRDLLRLKIGGTRDGKPDHQFDLV
jgi:hypothetical protein